MTNPYRALCAELADSVELLLEMRPTKARPLTITEERLSRARAELAQPEPEVLTDEEIWELYRDQGAGGTFSPVEFARAAIVADRARNSARDLGTWPSREEILTLGAELDERYDVDHGDVELVRAALARWGRPTPQLEGEGLTYAELSDLCKEHFPIDRDEMDRPHGRAHASGSQPICWWWQHR